MRVALGNRKGALAAVGRITAGGGTEGEVKTTRRSAASSKRSSSARVSITGPNPIQGIATRGSDEWRTRYEAVPPSPLK